MPAQRLADMHHTSWTAQNGLRGFPTSLAQTANGFLWVGTSEGVYRFDGLRFELYRPNAGGMAAAAVSALAATPDGGIWVGHLRGGMTYIGPDGRATPYTSADSLPGGPRSIAIDHDGVVWLAGGGGVGRFTAGRWERVRKSSGYCCSSSWDVFVDAKGTVWMAGATPNRLVYLRRGSKQFVDMGIDGSADGFAHLNDSTIVFGDSDYDLGTVYLLSSLDSTPTVRAIAAGLGTNGLTVDHQGLVWIAGAGITRFNPTGSPDSITQVERFTLNDGLSGNTGRAILVDREGSIWVATDGGLDRFRHRNLTWKPDSLKPLAAALFSDAAGEAWVATARPNLLRRARDFVPVPDAPQVIDNGYLESNGTLWLLGREGLFRWEKDKFISVHPPPEVIASDRRFTASAVTRQRPNRLWVSISGSGVFLVQDSVWTLRELLPGRPDWGASSAFTDSEERVWLTYRDEIASVRGDDVRIFGARDGLVGPITTIRGNRELLLVGNEQGLQVLHEERFYPVQFAGGALGSVLTIVPTDSAVWLAGSAGIMRIPKAEADSLAQDPAHRVRIDLFDMDSDLPDPPKLYIRSNVTGTVDGDGVLWFATNRGIARIDPRTIVRNVVPPPVAFRAAVADDQLYWPGAPITIPALTRSLRIEFTALSLVVPARVRFRHRLEGWETEWHGPHDRREVTYTDLRPGQYALRVMASNNDGVWNETGAALPFTVAPAWFQTAWFRALVLVTLVAAAIAAYRYRVRQLGAALSARFTERLSERTRIARELHDTVMQTVQASRMVADVALTRDEPAELRASMQQLSVWLGQAVDEGRGALKALRAATGSAADLADSLRQAAVNAAAASPAPWVITVRGTAPGELRPEVCDEIHHIGCEAILNACTHSHATQLELELVYGEDLLLRVSDNGVGIDPAVATNGKGGHYGLRGMRERAAAIGASLAIDTSSSGTTVALIVPGRCVYRADTLPRFTPPL